MPFQSLLKWLNLKFTKFALWVDKFVENRNLLSLPEAVWKPFQTVVFMHFIFAIIIFIMGIICFSFGLQYSTFYSRINCDDGINIWIPLDCLVASLTGLFAVKALHNRWSAFIHFIATVFTTPMMLFASVYSNIQVFTWQEEQRLSRGGKDWGTRNSRINMIIATFSYIEVLLSLVILSIYCKYWIPRNGNNNVGH